jgi:hypothetical protein
MSHHLPSYRLDLRRFEFKTDDPFIGVAATVRLGRSITQTCAELIALHFDELGLYVGRRTPAKDPRIAAEFKTIGRVIRVNGSVLVLDDCPLKTNEWNANELFFDASPDAIARVLRFSFGDLVPQIQSRLTKLEADFHVGPSCFKRLSSGDPSADFQTSRRYFLKPPSLPSFLMV